TLCKKADIVFLALHGENGENGRLQAALDLYGIKYTGSGYIESAMAMHKSIAKIQMLAGGVNVPDGFVLKKGEAVRIPGFPCIVKPNSGGSSIGVSIANDEAEYSKALKAAFEWEDTVLVEDYIKGREFSVCVIDHKALPVIEIAPLQGFYDYKNKYKAGSAIETCPAEITKEQTENMQEQAEKAAKALKLNTYSRMDFIMREDGKCYCLEANTLPGMTPTSLIPQEARAVGINFEDLCEKIINISLKKYEG
ncbi:MAG: D-alanine--D-alanine ligase, partial [Lachnospiraceae bacterium]|nr:D-alanine--D-alanine ligase [Lachnospiraceae bacterium]